MQIVKNVTIHFHGARGRRFVNFAGIGYAINVFLNKDLILKTLRLKLKYVSSVKKVILKTQSIMYKIIDLGVLCQIESTRDSF